MSKLTEREFTKEQQERLIGALARELLLYRARLGISQTELANRVGMTRQTYSAIENGVRDMTWNNYLAFICYFDNNAVTRKMLRGSAAYPAAFFDRINDGKDPDEDKNREIAGIPATFTDPLDRQALHTIRTVVMLEYARCTKTPGESVVRAFDGVCLYKKR